MYKGCPGEDSEDYVFSTPGFDPCHFFDFENGKTDIKYLLNCKAVDKQGFVLPDGHKEGLGYEYVNLVEQPVGRPFAYMSNDKGLRLTKGLEVSFTMDFRNWKYMSEFVRFEHKTSDPSIIIGEKEGV